MSMRPIGSHFLVSLLPDRFYAAGALNLADTRAETPRPPQPEPPIPEPTIPLPNPEPRPDPIPEPPPPQPPIPRQAANHAFWDNEPACDKLCRDGRHHPAAWHDRFLTPRAQALHAEALAGSYAGIEESWNLREVSDG